MTTLIANPGLINAAQEMLSSSDNPKLNTCIVVAISQDKKGYYYIMVKTKPTFEMYPQLSYIVWDYYPERKCVENGRYDLTYESALVILIFPNRYERKDLDFKAAKDALYNWKGRPFTPTRALELAEKAIPIVNENEFDRADFYEQADLTREEKEYFEWDDDEEEGEYEEN